MKSDAAIASTPGQRIAQIRAMKSMGMAEFADFLGVHRNTYRAWEEERTNPGIEALVALSADGWNANWVLTGKGPQRSDVTPAPDDGLKWDREILRSAIETVESALEIADVPFSNEGRAALIEAIYRHLLKKQRSAESVAEAMRMIREALKSGAGSG
jgi:transcriptional regulator with XRE-family HTH domain